MMANHYNVPVTVFCETFKFHEDIQTIKETKKNALVSSQTDPLQRALFDMTTSDMISAIVTEVQSGLLPKTSIPSLVRDRYN